MNICEMKIIVFLILSLVASNFSYKTHHKRKHGCTLTSRPPNPQSGCCGVDTTGFNMILGGEKATIRMYPWLALIEYKKRNRRGFETQCSGVLISGKYVLTAAHCVLGEILRHSIPVSVRLGEYDKSNSIHQRDCVTTYEGKECANLPVRVPIEYITPHQSYDEELDIDDIALIRLSKLIYATDFIRPICLPTSDVTQDPPEKLSFYAAGWGIMYQKRYRTWTKEYHSNVKRFVDLPYRTQKECGREWSEYIGKRKLCAGGEKGKGTCMGDSGGPLMHDNNGVFEVVGIVSYGVAEECGSSMVPDVFTKVIGYKNWIMRNINKSK